MRSATILLVLLAAPLVSCYPSLWAWDVLPNDVLKGAALTPQNCISHPTTKEGGHGPPMADRAIAITAADAAGKAVKDLCPGVEYAITVKYPEARRTLLSTTQGAWATANATCPGRLYTLKTEKGAESYKATLTVPCDTTAASTVLKVTSAAGPSASYKTATVQMNIAALSKCPASTCAANATLLVNQTMDGNMTSSLNDTAITEDDVKLASNLTGSADNATGSSAAAKRAEAPKAAAAAPAPAAKSAAVASSAMGMLAAAAGCLAMVASML